MSDVEETEAQRWCYKAGFEVLPMLFTLLAELGIEWKLIEAYPLNATVLFETTHEVECGWRAVSANTLERCWTEMQEGERMILLASARVDDHWAFEALLGTRDPPP